MREKTLMVSILASFLVTITLTISFFASTTKADTQVDQQNMTADTSLTTTTSSVNPSLIKWPGYDFGIVPIQWGARTADLTTTGSDVFEAVSLGTPIAFSIQQQISNFTLSSDETKTLPLTAFTVTVAARNNVITGTTALTGCTDINILNMVGTVASYPAGTATGTFMSGKVTANMMLDETQSIIIGSAYNATVTTSIVTGV